MARSAAAASGRVEIGARADAGQRHRQAGLGLPPFAEVGNLHQAVLGVGEAALVDDQPGVDLAALDRAEDAVVAHLHHLAEIGRRQPQQPEGGGLAPGDGHPPAHRLGQRPRLTGDHQRADAVAERRAAAQQPVARARPPAKAPTLSLVRSNAPSWARRFSSSMSSSTGRTVNGASTSPWTSAWKAKVSLGHGEKPKVSSRTRRSPGPAPA